MIQYFRAVVKTGTFIFHTCLIKFKMGVLRRELTVFERADENIGPYKKR